MNSRVRNGADVLCSVRLEVRSIIVMLLRCQYSLFQILVYVRVIFVSPVECPCHTHSSLWDLPDCHIVLPALILHGRKSCLKQKRSNGAKYSKEGGKISHSLFIEVT